MTTWLRTLAPDVHRQNTTGGTHVYGPNVDVRCDDCSPAEQGERCWVRVYGSPCERCGQDA